ncbi:hypothetical protein ACZ98_23330 (plasmid) [Vibrio parahaemolyticus]|nr:hypothetical protein ACZ98_23330 [Vibrio parahaemolyticus]
MSDFQPLVESNRRLTETVENKVGEIDQRVESAEQEYNQLINGIRSDFPFYRLTKNQELKIGGVLTVGSTGTPDGWANRDDTGHLVELVAFTETGVDPENKNPIIQDMFTDLLGGVPKHNQPNFAVIRVTTKPDYPPQSISKLFTLYQGPIPDGVPLTFGGWIKVESGEVRFLSNAISDVVPADGKWHEKIRHADMSNGGASYTFGPHLYIEPGASCLLALPAVVAGKVPQGKWGFINKPVLEHEG